MEMPGKAWGTNGAQHPEKQPTGSPEAAAARPVYEVGRREYLLLILALGLGILAADLLLSGLGLGVTVGVAAWYGVLLWYLGPRRLAESRSRLLFGAILLLALTFALFSNGWFRFWNLGALLMLLTVHAMQLSGAAVRPWYVPGMLWERFRLLLSGLFGRLGVLGALGKNLKHENARRAVVLGAGAAVTAVLVLLATVLLSQADQVFQKLTAGLLDFLWSHLNVAAAKLILGLCAAPFLLSLLYFLGRPKGLEKNQKEHAWHLDSVVPALLLGALDLLYVLFLCVQSAALFGGETYLRTMGISYADYARSGFFQLVFVTALNLTVLLVLMQLADRSRRGWRLIQALATGMVTLSGVILLSAGWRMTMYVLTYGLSFRRALTYWGMALMALFLGAACRKVWRAEFRFFRFAAAAALAGWLLLNYVPVDRVVAEYNVARYQAGTLEQIDLYYLSSLSYEALPALERLDGNQPLADWDDTTLAQRLETRAARAASACSRWETWSLSAWLAARSG